MVISPGSFIRKSVKLMLILNYFFFCVYFYLSNCFPYKLYDMCELCHQNKFVFVYFKSFGDCVDKQLPFRTQGDLKLVVMACNILRYFKLYCIMFCKVCKKLKWSFLTFFEFPFQYMQNGIIIITLTKFLLIMI